MSKKVIDVGVPPYEDLSNFTAYSFVFRDFDCASMEGLLQALKMHLWAKQDKVMQMTGIKAKRTGQKKKWYLDHILYWRGQPIDRFSDYYQKFIDEAFLCLFEQNEAFRKALLETGDTKLVHSHGKSDPKRTILTEDEFVSVLTRLRDGSLNRDTLNASEQLLGMDLENKLIHRIFSLYDNEGYDLKRIHEETKVSIEILKTLVDTIQHWAWRGIKGNLVQIEGQPDSEFNQIVDNYKEMTPMLKQSYERTLRKKKPVSILEYFHADKD